MATAGWNAWSGTPGAANRNLAPEDLSWLGQNQEGGFRNGFYYHPDFTGRTAASESSEYAPGTLSQWNRIAANAPGDINEGNRDWEAFSPEGSYSHSWIGSGRTEEMRNAILGLGAVGGGMALGGVLGGAAGAVGGAEATAGLTGVAPITADTLGLSTAGQAALGTAGVGAVPSALGPAGAATGGGLLSGLSARDIAGAATTVLPLAGAAGAPGPTDTTGLANAQTTENQRINEANLRANRPTVNSPFGTSTWSQDANGNWTQNVSLSPDEQARLDQRNRLGRGAGEAAERALAGFSSPFSFGGNAPQGARASQPDISNSPFGRQRELGASAPGYGRFGMSGQWSPEMAFGFGPGMSRIDPASAQSPNYNRFNGQGPNARDLYGAQGYAPQRQSVEQATQARFDRLREPQLRRQEAGLDVQLRNQGLMPGTEGYDNAMNDLRQQQSAERSDLADRAILAGGAEQSRLAGIDLSADAQRFGQQQQGFRNRFDTTGYNNELTGREAGDTFNRGLQAFGFNNQAGQGEFDNYLRSIGQRNAASESATAGNFSRGLTGLTYNNNLSRQGLTDALDIGKYNAGQDQDVWGRYADTYRFGADEREREYNRDFRSNAYNDDRSLQERNQGLSEFQAFGGWGGPTNMPLQGPTGVSNQTPVNYYGAGMDSYGQGVDAYNRYMNAIQTGLNYATNWWRP